MIRSLCIAPLEQGPRAFFVRVDITVTQRPFSSPRWRCPKAQIGQMAMHECPCNSGAKLLLGVILLSSRMARSPFRVSDPQIPKPQTLASCLRSSQIPARVRDAPRKQQAPDSQDAAAYKNPPPSCRRSVHRERPPKEPRGSK
jgi:hypothetical protein